jgi:hypothetical protein
MAEISSLTKSILLTPDIDLNLLDFDLSKSDFFRYLKERSNKISPLVLPEIKQISSSLAAELNVPLPDIRITKLRGKACYESETHAVSLSEYTPLHTAHSLMYHEFIHIGQDKLKAAAVIAHPDKYRESTVHQSLLDAAQEQELHKHPLSVSIGELFIKSSETVLRLEDFAYEDGRQHLIDMYKGTYQNSFQELPARIAEGECMLRIAEAELRLSTKMLERFESASQNILFRINKFWNSNRVQAFYNKLCRLKEATLKSLDEDIGLILPKVELGLRRSKSGDFS